MIVTTQATITSEQSVLLQAHLERLGTNALPLEWNGAQNYVLGDTALDEHDIHALTALGADRVISLKQQYQVVSRAFQPANTIVNVSGVTFGGEQVPVIVGPCSVETEDQMAAVVAGARRAGCTMIRGGAYKPRTSPYAFQGHGELGLELLCDAAHPKGLPVVTEIMDIRELDAFMKHNVDAIQVGTRNMQNFSLLKELGATRIPIILKRGMSATLSEWLMAAEYIASGGNSQIILCERGIRTFETAYRNVLDVTGVIVAKKETHLPVIVDPSHAGGKAWMVAALAKAAIAVGADGLLVEMHPNPKESWCDADQALSIEEIEDLVPQLDAVAQAVGRSILA